MEQFNIIISSCFVADRINDAAKASILKLYAKEGYDSLFNFARERKILPFVANLFVNLGIDVEPWGQILNEYRTRNENVIKQLDLAFTELDNRSVRKIAVKENFAALLMAGVDVALFASGDVDIFADISERDEIYTAFESLGFYKKERFSHNKIINTDFYNPDVLPEKFCFSVSWSPFTRLKLPSLSEADSFVDWKNLWIYDKTAIRLPDADALMYICLLHISLHSFSRAPDIRLYFDILNMSKVSINWGKVLCFAENDETEVRLLTSVVLANKLMGVDIPEEILEKRYSKKNKRNIDKILKLVYNEENNSLWYEPRGTRLLLIEALSEGKSVFVGLLRMLFPQREWVKETYLGDGGSVPLAYFKHFRNLL